MIENDDEFDFNIDKNENNNENGFTEPKRNNFFNDENINNKLIEEDNNNNEDNQEMNLFNNFNNLMIRKIKLA